MISTLPNFRVRKLNTLVIRNEAWNISRGSPGLVAVWKGADCVTPLTPRVLYLNTQCRDQHLINALTILSELEGLYLGVVRPDELGKKFFPSKEVALLFCLHALSEHKEVWRSIPPWVRYNERDVRHSPGECQVLKGIVWCGSSPIASKLHPIQYW